MKLFFASLYEAEGNLKKALEYYKLYSELNDSIYSEGNAMKLAELQALPKSRDRAKHSRRAWEILLEASRNSDFAVVFDCAAGARLQPTTSDRTINAGT